MHAETAYARRETLTDNELERLQAALENQVMRYSESIRGYSPEKMDKYGQPHLSRLQARVDEIVRLRASRQR